MSFLWGIFRMTLRSCEPYRDIVTSELVRLLLATLTLEHLGSRVIPCGQTDRHVEAYSRYFRIAYSSRGLIYKVYLLTCICLSSGVYSVWPWDLASSTVILWRQKSFGCFSQRWPWNTLRNRMCGVACCRKELGGKRDNDNKRYAMKVPDHVYVFRDTYTGLFISPSGISHLCGTVTGMVTPKGNM
jgi:hypothetical protein